jgi:hypothetical protein
MVTLRLSALKCISARHTLRAQARQPVADGCGLGRRGRLPRRDGRAAGGPAMRGPGTGCAGRLGGWQSQQMSNADCGPPPDQRHHASC